MACSTKRRVIVSCSVGWLLAILGAVMIPVLEWVVKRKIQNSVIISPDSPVYDYWQNPPVPIYMQIYMFNLTNPAEFLAGEKPSLAQSGPYTYLEKRIKFNITWNSNGTVTYRQKRVFTFLPDMSVGDELTDKFLTPNPIYWALMTALQFETAEIRKLVVDVLHMLDEYPLMTRSTNEVIWGYTSPILHFVKQLDPVWFYSDYIGYFVNKNNTDDGVYTVFTGEKDINMLGIINRFNGTTLLSFWTTKWANMINGTDGTLGPPYQSKYRRMYSFVPDVCRSISGSYKGDVETSQGISLWRFGADNNYLANASVVPDNVGFCTPQSHCLGAGVFNVTQCSMVDFFHLPAILSFPHYYLADPKYLDAVIGLNPNAEEHNPNIDAEPYTGLVLRAAKKLQFNIYLQPPENITETQYIKPVFMPVFWINESASIDDHNAAKFKRLVLTPMKIIHISEICAISLGVAIVIGTLIYSIWRRAKTNLDIQKRRVSTMIASNHVCDDEREHLVNDYQRQRSYTE